MRVNKILFDFPLTPSPLSAEQKQSGRDANTLEM